MIQIAKPIIGLDEINAVVNVLSSGIIAEGPRVAAFEKAFANYVKVDYAVAMNSGTAALHAALLAHNIGANDEVITSPFTFIATSNSILFTGARPVFADIVEDTFNIDPDSILEKITQKTKAIIPVHLFGHPAEMKAIMEIAEDHRLVVIEDACQAHGAFYNGKKVGSFGTGTFSFYPTKNMTTSEGGMITTNDVEIVKRTKMIRSHGSKVRYMHEMLGYNLRMTDISAAIGLVQLTKLDEFNKKRQRNANYLFNGLRNVDCIKLPIVKTNCTHVFNQYTIKVKNRDHLISVLNEYDIGTGIYYPLPLHRQPFYQRLGYDESLPVSEYVANHVLSIPVHPEVSCDDLDKIIDVIKLGVDSHD